MIFLQAAQMAGYSLSRILPGCDVLRAVRYRVEGQDDQKSWAECDGLVMYDGHLIVVEVKAGAFTAKSPTIDVEAHIHSLKNLVVAPIRQGRRFVEQLRKQGKLEIVDADMQPLAGLQETDFRDISVCCITLDQLTNQSPQLEHLRIAGLVGDEPVWPVSVDDLRVFADIFDNPLVFLHFLIERKRAFGSSVVEMKDELDHLGAYLKHGRYTDYAAKTLAALGGKGTMTGWRGYRDPIDRFYHLQLHGKNPSPPRQDGPSLFWQLIEQLARSGTPGRSVAAAELLEFSADHRRRFVNAIRSARRRNAKAIPPRQSVEVFVSNGEFFVSGARRIRDAEPFADALHLDVIFAVGADAPVDVAIRWSSPSPMPPPSPIT